MRRFVANWHFICPQLCAWKKPSLRRAQLHHYGISVLVLLTNFVPILERLEIVEKNLTWNFEMPNSCCLVSFGFDLFYVVINLTSIYKCERSILVIWAAVAYFHFSSLSRFPALGQLDVGLSFFQNSDVGLCSNFKPRFSFLVFAPFYPWLKTEFVMGFDVRSFVFHSDLFTNVAVEHTRTYCS